MDEKKAIHEVVVALGSVAQLLRSYPTPDLAEAANRLERIAQHMSSLRAEAANGNGAHDPAADLVSDTLVMLESFRRIENPVVRKAVIAMIKALRPEQDG